MTVNQTLLVLGIVVVLVMSYALLVAEIILED